MTILYIIESGIDPTMYAGSFDSALEAVKYGIWLSNSSRGRDVFGVYKKCSCGSPKIKIAWTDLVTLAKSEQKRLGKPT